MRASFTQ
jgi:hypothetical protein